MYKYSVSWSTLRHVFTKHKDLVKALGVRDLKELYDKLKISIEHADEVYADMFNVKYYIKKLNELYANVIVYGNVVKTAYLLSPKTFNRMRRKRWIRKLS